VSATRKVSASTVIDAVIFILVISFLVLNLLGIVTLAVVEGKSMEPTLQTGDLVLVIRVSPKDIHVGDIIVYKKLGGTFIIHRVIKIKHVDDQFYYVTQGDNNPIPDGPGVPYRDVIGKVVSINDAPIKIPVIGYLSLMFRP